MGSLVQIVLFICIGILILFMALFALVDMIGRVDFIRDKLPLPDSDGDSGVYC